MFGNLVVVLLSVFFRTSGVCSEEDITGVPEFGCQWTGGSLDSGVTCSCEPDAREFIINKGSIPAYNTIRLKIEHCYSLRFNPKSISEMRNLRNIELSNIANLYFEEFGLSWNSYQQSNNDFYSSWDGTPTLKVHVERSTIKRISSYAFQGKISSVIFRESTIEDLFPYGFSSLGHTQHIEFLNVNFIQIQAQALKKFPTELLIISDSTFNVVPSRAFSDVIVLDTFQIRNCSFNVITPYGFLVYNPKHFELANSNINSLEGEGFKVTTRGSVKIRNNIFNKTSNGAFMGVCLNKEEVLTDEEMWFDSNIFNTFGKRSLEINSTSFSVKYTNILINEKCECKFAQYELDEDQFHCLFDGKKVTIKNFTEDNCSVLTSYSTIIIILGVLLILFIIIFTGLVVYFKRVYKAQREYLTDKNGKPVSLIMPDGRTYRETELHVVVERADLLTTDL